MTLTKHCRVCNQDKDKSEFAPAKSRHDGLEPLCRPCERQRSLDRYQRRKSDPAYVARCRKATQAWRDANPEALKLHVLERRARMRENGVYRVTPKDIRKLKDQACCYCGSVGVVEIEHVLPISRGGRHSIGNLAPACRDCNRQKSNRTVMEWRIKCLLTTHSR